jgi:hypothetical protein
MRFLTGDILVAASSVPENVDLRNLHGPGRVLHLDAQFNLKRTLATQTDGLVIGLAVDPLSGDLFAADARARTVVRFEATGSAEPQSLTLPPYKFGSLAFKPDGQLVLGVHNLLGKDSDADPDLLWCNTPGTDRLSSWPVEFDGGKLEFHRVSFLSLDPLGERLLYASENGRRILQFDLAMHRQRKDFLELADNDPRGTFGLDQLPDGRVLMATGLGASLFSPRGKELLRYPIDERRGWSRVALSNDNRSFFVNNFLEGIIERRRIDNGKLVRRHDVQHRHSLCGIVEYPIISRT